jgi:RNA polymerase-binding protein DksA
MLEKLKDKLKRKHTILLGRIRRAKENVRLNGTQSDVMAILQDRSEEQVEEIEVALQRMEAGSYGVCEKCGQPIKFERLEALPTASACVECQERQDRK